MRILALFFHPTVYGEDRIGGIERRFIEVSKVMRRLGISVYALEFYPSLSRSVEIGYVSYEINQPFPRLVFERIVSVIQALRLGIAVYKKRQFQVIVVAGHRYLTFTILCAYVLSKLLHLPWVIVSGGLLPREKMSLHDLLTDRRTRGFTYPSALTHTAADWFTKQLTQRANGFIAVSQSERREVIEFLGVRPAKIHVVANGVNLNLIDSIPEKQKQFDAAFLGRVEPGKGIHTLIRSWEKVVERIPTADLIVIGGGRTAYYKRFIKGKNLVNNIKLTGFVPFEQAMALLKRSRIFLFPSKRESFPLSLLEAMACGLPCVASDIQPLRENFRKGIIFVQPNTPEAFTEATIALLNNVEKLKAIGAQAREYATMFSWENTVSREVAVLMSVLRQSRQ